MGETHVVFPGEDRERAEETKPIQWAIDPLTLEYMVPTDRDRVEARVRKFIADHDLWRLAERAAFGGPLLDYTATHNRMTVSISAKGQRVFFAMNPSGQGSGEKPWVMTVCVFNEDGEPAKWPERLTHLIKQRDKAKNREAEERAVAARAKVYAGFGLTAPPADPADPEVERIGRLKAIREEGK